MALQVEMEAQQQVAAEVDYDSNVHAQTRKVYSRRQHEMNSYMSSLRLSQKSARKLGKRNHKPKRVAMPCPIGCMGFNCSSSSRQPRCALWKWLSSSSSN